MEQQQIRELFIRHGSRREKKKNQFIFDPSISRKTSEAYFLDQGTAALACINEAGEEIVYLYFGEKRIIGFSQILARRYQYHYHSTSAFWIIARSPCVYYAMDEVTFNQLLEKEPAFSSAVLGALTSNYLDVVNKAQRAHDMDKETMLCECLLNCMVSVNGRSVIPKPFTFVEIAKFLGMHPVTVSRLAKKLRDLGLIERCDGYLVIPDAERLRTYMEKRLE